MDPDTRKFYPTLSLDDAHYRKCYQTFTESMHFNIPYEPWYNHVLGTAIRHKLEERSKEQVIRNFDKDWPLRHLGVGSGSGELERQIIAALLRTSKYIYNRVLEPSVHQMNIYQEMMQKDTALTTYVEFDWRQQTLEEYIADKSRKQDRFNVITAIHSIYYGGPLEEKIPYLFDALADGGVMVFVLISETDSLSKVQSQFLSPDIPGYRYYTKEKLQSFLGSNNIQYETIDIPRCTIDVTSCFDAGSSQGALLLDFLSHMRFFRTEVPPDSQEKFCSLLEQNLQRVNNKCLLTHDTSAIIVQRANNKKFGE